MPKVTVEVTVEGGPLPQGVEVRTALLSMSLQGHHTAQVRLASTGHAGETETRSQPLDEVFKKIGKAARVAFKPEEVGTEVVLEGFVARATHERQRDGDHTLLVTVWSPTMLLEGGPRCRVWEKKSAKEIADSILESASMLHADVAKLPSTRIPYEAQYEESDFSFLKRLAARSGKWLYYDGAKLAAVDSFDAPAVKIGVGKREGEARFELFSVEARLAPGAFLHTSVIPDSKEDAQHGDSEGRSTDASHDFVKIARDRSNDLFKTKAHPAHLGEVFAEADQKEQAKVWSQSWLGSLVVASGTTSHPGLKPGSVVEIGGTGGSEDAKYVVESADHTYAGSLGYQCSVSLVPVAAAFPPAVPAPRATSLQRAVVVNRYSAEAPGMVKVRYARAVDGTTEEGEWSDGQAVTTWVRVATPHAGEAGGFISLPEEGDEVLVAHAGGRATLPIVIGSLYTKDKKSKVFDEVGDLLDGDKNEGKAFLTKSGNLLLFKDTAGKETIELRNPEGKNVFKMTMDGGAKVLVETEGEVQITAKKDVTVKADGAMTFEAKGDMKLETKGKFSLEATGNAELKSQQSIKAEGQMSVELKGMQLKAEGSTTAEFIGAKVDVKGSALTSIQGALVKIN